MIVVHDTTGSTMAMGRLSCSLRTVPSSEFCRRSCQSVAEPRPLSNAAYRRTARAAAAIQRREVASEAATARVLALADAALKPLVAVLLDSRLRDPKGPGAAGFRCTPSGCSAGYFHNKFSADGCRGAAGYPGHRLASDAAVDRGKPSAGAAGGPLIQSVLARLATATLAYQRDFGSPSRVPSSPRLEAQS